MPRRQSDGNASARRVAAPHVDQQRGPCALSDTRVCQAQDANAGPSRQRAQRASVLRSAGFGGTLDRLPGLRQHAARPLCTGGRGGSAEEEGGPNKGDDEASEEGRHPSLCRPVAGFLPALQQSVHRFGTTNVMASCASASRWPGRLRQAASSIASSSSSAPCLCSGSLRLPHFGDCTHDGQPDSHGHSLISRCASRVSCSNWR